MKIIKLDKVDRGRRAIGGLVSAWLRLCAGTTSTAAASKVSLLLFPVPHTGKNHGTKFIHTIIWCPGEAETKATDRAAADIDSWKQKYCKCK